ncbi:MAG: Lsr2 family protein [Actinomycetota bacterium]|nr:Lsr2 family protein [Actinomycetota bacterium]
MAQKVQVILVDDLDGGPAEETVTFALDGVGYEIDLNENNARKLRDSLATYVGSARRGSGGRGGSTGRGRTSRGRSSAARPAGNNAEIRDWAKRHGHSVNERGRIPTSVVEAYEQAHAS